MGCPSFPSLNLANENLLDATQSRMPGGSSCLSPLVFSVLRIFVTTQARPISCILVLNRVWKQRTMRFGGNNNCLADGRCLVVELCGVGMTTPSSMITNVYLCVGWFAVFCAEMTVVIMLFMTYFVFFFSFLLLSGPWAYQ